MNNNEDIRNSLDDDSEKRLISQKRDTRLKDITVIKIGGSTLGEHDTSLQDVVDMKLRGLNPVVVHGGGALVSSWMKKNGIIPQFVGGLRVTNRESLDVAIAVLTGLVNKSLVAEIQSLGCLAVGISGVDANTLIAEVVDNKLGYVGKIVDVRVDVLRSLIQSGYIPVVSSVAMTKQKDNSDSLILNINADHAAGEIAIALQADSVVFMTDVPGIMDSSRRLISRVTKDQAQSLINSKVIDGGMIPKVESCCRSLDFVKKTYIVDGRKSHVLRDLFDGKFSGTRIG
ncbi:MAG: acetylglutamate kinase [SAR202 cluster bacterium]|nr:acetylglutamate kinase [SAR202 cluster bacterium]|tara:strand:+ start:660 stop:1517 length:858 start_codon:yes stop_codon:yes gene_type:complete